MIARVLPVPAPASTQTGPDEGLGGDALLVVEAGEQGVGASPPHVSVDDRLAVASPRCRARAIEDAPGQQDSVAAERSWSRVNQRR